MSAANLTGIPCKIVTITKNQGHMEGFCLAVMTGPFVLQVLSIKANKY